MDYRLPFRYVNGKRAGATIKLCLRGMGCRPRKRNLQEPRSLCRLLRPGCMSCSDDFYLTSSSFGCLPGLQILHSKDLVNWSIISAAVPTALPPVTTPERPEHGNRVWAPSIRHHNGEFYIFWGDPDQGAFMVKAKDPQGPWTEPVLVKPGKGIIDTCPLWDEDGKVYLVHAYAGSRAGLKSVITI